MRPVLPVLLKDFYKVGHKFQYPSDTTMVYSNFTPRSSRVEGVDRVVAFGFQYFVQEYLLDQFRENFFWRTKDYVIKKYKRRIDNALGAGTKVDHIAQLHDIGWLPIEMKALPEGTLVPLRVPVLTIRNTKPEFYWLTNMLETLLSNVLWLPSTTATTAFRYRSTFEKYCKLTGGPRDFVKWQGHDFSFRGMAGIEAACLSGAAHLLSFTGTDTIPAIDFLETYYGADSDKELIGGSVPATEHSVMSMGTKEGEIETIKRLLTEIYPTGILSLVSDTWDLFKVLSEYLPQLREVVKTRDGKLVIRPDSGDPVKIICGDPEGKSDAERKGAIRLLYEVFGGVRNQSGFIELDPHIGLIYGDSITPERQEAILSTLMANGFASTNIVLGQGSFGYQYVTRDTYGWAVKSTYGETLRGPQNIFKDPKTDDGTKKSATGLLKVEESPIYEFDGDRSWPKRAGEVLICKEKCDWPTEQTGLLQTIFKDGVSYNKTTLAEIRALIEKNFA